MVVVLGQIDVHPEDMGAAVECARRIAAAATAEAADPLLHEAEAEFAEAAAAYERSIGKLRALLAREEALGEDDLVLAAGLVEAAGGKTWTENEAGTQLAAAHKCLADTDMPGDVRAEFAGIAEFITARQW